VKIALDASMALAWHIERVAVAEGQLAQEALDSVRDHGAVVPPLWYSEVANGLLVAERRNVSSEQDITLFCADLAQLDIEMDSLSPDATLSRVIAIGRTSTLTGYDATYLELVLRTGRTLATFDRQLADAVRKAGGQVFGDAA